MNFYISTSAVMIASSVALGALGAHGFVHDMVQSNGYLEQWQTAVFYISRLAWFFIFAGIILFSGSL